MGKFRDAMLRDLEIRGKAPKTCEAYLRAMEGLVRYCKRSPDQLTPGDIKRYQHYLIHDLGRSYTTLNIAVCAFRFFYKHTLPVRWSVERLPYHQKPKRLPVILSRDEIVRIFEAVDELRRRVILMTIYGAGLRLREALQLRVEDINSERMVLEVRRGKGAKDRYVPLSNSLLRLLREYWRAERPRDLLFPGKNPERPLNPRTVQRLLRRAARRADIQKRITPHSLRHAFATHLLEDGAHIRAVQTILGHASLTTTTIYLHCTQEYLSEVKSPLDRLHVDGASAAG